MHLYYGNIIAGIICTVSLSICTGSSRFEKDKSRPPAPAKHLRFALPQVEAYVSRRVSSWPLTRQTGQGLSRYLAPERCRCRFTRLPLLMCPTHSPPLVYFPNSLTCMRESSCFGLRTEHNGMEWGGMAWNETGAG